METKGVNKPGIGRLVKARRLARGWTQRELGAHLGVDKSYVSLIETNARRWPEEYIADLSRLLGLGQVELAAEAGLIRVEAIAEATPPYDASSPEDALRQVYPDLSEESIQSIKGFAAYLQDQERREQRTQRRVEREAG